LRYKKIKFIEKRKVIRSLEKIDKELKTAEDSEALKEQKQLWQDKLTYIDNYPPTWKYVSLFAKSGDEEKDKLAEEQRDLNMKKIQKTVEVRAKIREKELIQADKDSDDEMIEEDMPVVLDYHSQDEESEQSS
jgi:hypothetical protein